jgi:hypothetical protein
LLGAKSTRVGAPLPLGLDTKPLGAASALTLILASITITKQIANTFFILTFILP